mmetsp:Transcript_42133/g.83770  ORF Transcript_42133/g.83770 Transcript_42133/m.83770 type:complete len:81 (+) Transcript_42133:79-321(+)|eukprot:CAMPEP_0170387710 /NCGR_PEP_ID=MMETSP0117_2-20130122/17700_1 /TAXON_ID=400756 /ORGANISM="Durinskia baltica, Strain CSIRO CS-38" /LENGTH=80 /DNA_ID=CAMNT_0010643591 /DNA_START=76 /DNA_END=318 /DNA_ORIENTATION=-
MSSGMGLYGNIGRCFKPYEEFAMCMKGSEDPVKHCLGMRNHYLDCLHKDLKEEEMKKMLENEKKKNGVSGNNSGGGHGSH